MFFAGRVELRRVIYPLQSLKNHLFTFFHFFRLLNKVAIFLFFLLIQPLLVLTYFYIETF